VLYGAQKADAMAKVCGVDLRPEVFSEGMVAQTQVARVNAIVAHHHLDTDGSVFSLLCDSAAANYFQEVLLDAIREYNNE
jgi:sarcosine oxidase subunit gamma